MSRLDRMLLALVWLGCGILAVAALVSTQGGLLLLALLLLALLFAVIWLAAGGRP